MMNMQRFWRTAGTFLFTLIFGLAGSLFFFIFLILGLVRVRGYWKLVRAVHKGRLIIAANHPTLLEGVLIPALLGPWMLLNPQRYFVWSTPDGSLFPRRLRWLYDISHSIKVYRKNTNRNYSPSLQILKILKSGASVVIYPEGGRTNSPTRNKQKPKRSFGQLGDRKIRWIDNTRVPDLALRANALIIPIWIDVPFRKEEDGFKRAWKIWISKFHTITIHIGEPYKVDQTKNLNQKNSELAQHILNA